MLSLMFSWCRPYCIWLGGALLSLLLVSAQDPAREADAHFNNHNFALALEAYKKVLEKQEASLALVKRIADCYRFLNNSREAEFWYAQTLTFPNPQPENLKFFADAARKNGNYEKARLLYLRYANQVPAQAQQARQLAANCQQVQQWIDQPAPYHLSPLPALSSENLDFSPVFYQQGLVFTSDRPLDGSKAPVSGWTGKPLAKLFYAPQENGAFTRVEPLPEPLNSKFENGSAVFNQAQDQVFFTRVNKIKGKPGKAYPDLFNWVNFDSGPALINRLEIYMAEKQGERWSEPVPFPYNNKDAYSLGHPALSASGDTLYFASDMPGGLGSTDLYFSVKDRLGRWGKPVNAGPAINTPGKELFPVVAANGWFYFSSEGHNGMGGLDLYQAKGTGARWQQVQNLRYPLNSSADDFGILFDKTGQAGYLSTNRHSADGSDNIYAFRYVAPTCALTGWTLEMVPTRPGVQEEAPIPQARVQLTNDHDTTTLTTFSDEYGNFTIPVRQGVTYTIKGTKPGYLAATTTLTGGCESVLNLVKLGVPMLRKALNKPIILDKIFYDLDSYEIRSEAALELDKLVQAIKDNPGIQIELSSHTDSRQTKAYNKLLSKMRADAAVNYMIAKGVPRSSITARGYGETRLLNKCADGVSCPEQDHQLNRRTEIKILKLGDQP